MKTNYLEKIQKGMRVFQILFKIIMIFYYVGIALTSIAAMLVVTDVLNIQSQFLNLVSVTDEINKQQIVGSLVATDISLLFGGILSTFTYRYFTFELKEGTPFTNGGADRIKQLGIITIVISLISTWIIDIIYEMINISEGNRFDDAGGIVFGIFLILLSTVIRYGAELEKVGKEKLEN